MKTNDAFAILKPESPFYSLFPEGRVPITKQTAVSPAKVVLEGSTETEVYYLENGRCTRDQVKRIVAVMSQTFNVDPAEVMNSIDAGIRVPIRKSQVDQVEGAGIDLRMVL